MNLAVIVEVGLMALVLLFSVIIHEIAHGYVAWLNGDPTARLSGRITMNPLPHIDPIGTIFVPLLLVLLPLLQGRTPQFVIGWARPVPVNPSYFRHHRLGELTVSAAGPLSNLALAFLFAWLFSTGIGGAGLKLMAAHGLAINLALAIFNLLPIPPLDGSHIVSAFLPYRLARLYSLLEPFGFFIILILLATPLWRYIFDPPFVFLLSLIQNLFKI